MSIAGHSTHISRSASNPHLPFAARPADCGVCINCADEATCMNLARAKAPVRFCEEHQLTAVSAAEPVAPDPWRPTPTWAGLCDTCESSDNCSLTSTPRGVWRCEEFR